MCSAYHTSISIEEFYCFKYKLDTTVSFEVYGTRIKCQHRFPKNQREVSFDPH